LSRAYMSFSGFSTKNGYSGTLENLDFIKKWLATYTVFNYQLLSGNAK
jgi:hypothetical protein